MWRALCLVVIVLGSSVASAQVCAPQAPPAKLVVGTVPVAPFIIKRDDGWGGISMDLWAKVAQKEHLDYEVRELTVKDLGDPAVMSQLDAFVSLNVTAEREQQMDLTHAFYSTGLAIAVAPRSDDGFLTTMKAIFTTRFAKLIAGLFALLLGVGVAMWLLERKRNEAHSAARQRTASAPGCGGAR